MEKEITIQYHSLKDKVFRFAKKILNNHEDANDIVQDVFEKLWNMRNETKLNNIEAFSMKMTKNLCLDRLKNEQRKNDKFRIIQSNRETQINDNYDSKDTCQFLRAFINELPDKQKMIIHLRDIESLEFDEISTIMDMDINAVRMNLSRGRKALKEKLIKTMNYGL